MKVLNKELYTALCKRFGRVQVYLQGETATFSVEAPLAIDPMDKVHRGRNVSGGERYVVACPWCGRNKLWFSYLAGAVTTINNAPIHFGEGLVICYRCEGQRVSDNLKQLWKDLEDNGYREKELKADVVAPRQGGDTDFETHRAMDPGAFPATVPLCGSGCPEAVRVYLRGRGIDPEELETFTGARWSDDPFNYGYGIGRIIFPVYQHRVLVGWQGRSLDKDVTKDSPKYIFPYGCSPAHWLYNLDNAKWMDPVVLVEGVFDVFKVGPHGVGRFGKKTHYKQLLMLQHIWGGRSLIYIPDTDDPRAIAVARGEIADWNVRGLFKGGVHLVTLPAGKDPGDMDFTELQEIIQEQSGKEITGWQ